MTTSKSISERIIEAHLVEGKMEAGEEIAIRIDQTLTQDATGTLVYMFFEAMDVPRVRTGLSVSYIDHNTLQTDSRNADDHLYLQTVASKYGVILSKAGNGICHSVHLERFARPGWTLIGSDSHTPTSGALGMIAIGAGGLDVATVMTGEPYYFRMPEIVGVKLEGKRPPWVSAKDIILHLLRTMGVKGGVGKSLEYFGDGVRGLTVPERATITNMGTETGATTSIFPSDEEALKYLRQQGREKEWIALPPPEEEVYGEVIEVDLSSLEPLIAMPHSPGNVVEVRELEGLKVDQVCIGSCTNSSYRDLMTVAAMLRGKRVHPDVSLVVSPGSRQVLRALIENGALSDLISAGARILECACGPCIGMGQAPPSKGISLRTFNRNFEGRSGTKDAEVYLASPEVAAATAMHGVITDPRKLGTPPEIPPLERFKTDSSLLLKPAEDPSSVSVIRGPNIKPPSSLEPLAEELEGEVLLKVGDDVTTDHILPAGAKILPLRSNIPEISKYTFSRVDSSFATKALRKGGGFVVGGENYGQGSSREHAALCPRYLGVKAVIAKSFARIHKSNLINFGVLPLEFLSKTDYEEVNVGDALRTSGIRMKLERGEKEILVKNLTQGFEFKILCDLPARSRRIILAGSLLNFIKEKKRVEG